MSASVFSLGIRGCTSPGESISSSGDKKCDDCSFVNPISPGESNESADIGDCMESGDNSEAIVGYTEILTEKKWKRSATIKF